MGDLTALEICTIAIQLALCMQLGTICIHLYSAPKLLEKASFKLEPQYECSVLPRIFLRNSGGAGIIHTWCNNSHHDLPLKCLSLQIELIDLARRDYLAFVFIAAPLVMR